MGRSNTLPLQSSASARNAGSKNITRSNTTAPEPKHHIHIPHHPHLPAFIHHHHNNSTSNNNARDRSSEETYHEPLSSTAKRSTSIKHSSSTPLKHSSSTASQAPGLTRQSSVHTRYVSMLLAQDTIPRFHTILAASFTWILLAGFLVFPGTFTSIQKLEAKEGDEAGKKVLEAVKNVKLIYVGAVCCGVGAGGMVWLWIRHRTNFVWLLNRIFLPGCLNSFAGLISTLINVYSQQQGHWSTTAWITASVTGGVMAITGILFGLYNFWLLEKVRRKHDREMGTIGEDGDVEEGLKEKMERKTKEPALEPGSVV